MPFFGYVLVALHGTLLLWAVGGFFELLLPSVPWKPFANPEFPTWLLVIHWGSILFASICFLYGYFDQWNRTPHAMALAYGVMALVCAVETFGFMTSGTKYLTMAAEYLAYGAILLVLFKTNYFIDYFG